MSKKKGSSSLSFARRGISCRYENTIQKINKTEPILSINIHNAVMYFKGSFVIGFITVQNGSMLNTCSQCFFSGLPVSHESPGRSWMLAATILFVV